MSHPGSSPNKLLAPEDVSHVSLDSEPRPSESNPVVCPHFTGLKHFISVPCLKNLIVKRYSRTMFHKIF